MNQSGPPNTKRVGYRAEPVEACPTSCPGIEEERETQADAMRATVKRLTDENATLYLMLDGCSGAAFGQQWAEPGDGVYSAAMGDVLSLRTQYEALVKKCAELEVEAQKFRDMQDGVKAIAEQNRKDARDIRGGFIINNVVNHSEFVPDDG